MRICATVLLLLVIFVPAALSQPVLQGESEDMPYAVEKQTQGFDVIWGMAFLNPREIIFTERSGSFHILDRQTGQVHPLTGAPSVLAVGQGGLLDVAVPAEYEPGDWIYFTYSKKQDKGGVTALGRFRRDGNRVTEQQDLLISQSASDTSKHYGSRIAFDGKGHIYMTVGERGVRPNAQNLHNHAGSILRLDMDGSVPGDNPFAGRQDALPEIWSYGHRNPQGIAYDFQTERLWAIEHGPRGGDEINHILPGRNYGWPVISYGKEYWGPVPVGEGTHKVGMEQPVKMYDPSIAPGSLIVYSGKAFPGWQGNLMAGALKLRHLNRIVLDPAGRAVDEERLLAKLGERIRALIESPEGWLYFSTDSGKIFCLRPAEF